MQIPLAAEVRDLLALHLVPGLGPRLTAALLHRFGSAGAVLQAAAAQLQEVPHIGPKLASDLCQAMRKTKVEEEWELIERHGVQLLARGTPDYPKPLEAMVDPPYLLYVRGSTEPRDANAVAVVGSRSSSAYGKRVAERLATGLVRAGITVVSGLARGIDGCAHRAALKAGGRTLAVLAGGLCRIYPPEHAELADEVAAAGALITEANMNMEPMAGMFPARNRIISGLSRAVVIVEAAEKSGALITASHAADQGRPVFAVPGPIESTASGGTNALIRKGAILIRGVDDILEELDGIKGAAAAPTQPPPKLDGLQGRIWEMLVEQPQHVDELVQKLQTPVGEVAGALLMLEMKKAVRRLPGNQYERR
jgi:DNA processing protein